VTPAVAEPPVKERPAEKEREAYDPEHVCHVYADTGAAVKTAMGYQGVMLCGATSLWGVTRDGVKHDKGGRCSCGSFRCVACMEHLS
jgi:hypothetical protein